MDLKKCRTCFIDLDANDLFLKLDQVHKNSKLSLGEKLKLCVPQMDLRYSDKLYICMQCSMHLETAYTFHMTCLKTEEEVQRHISQVFHNIQDSKRSDKGCVKEEENKDIVAMHCHICNINFISRNIFDLHMRVMHRVNKSTSNNNDEELDVSKSKKIKKEELDNSMEKKVEIPKNQKRIDVLRERPKSDTLEDKKKSDIVKDKKRPLVQMVLLQTNIESSLIKEKKRNHQTNDKSKEEGRKRKIEKLKEVGRIVANSLERQGNGRFKPKSTLQANMKTHLNNIKVTKIMKKTKQENESSKNIRVPIGKCKFCPKKITSAGALSQHVIALHKEKCNRCNVCKRYFIDIEKHKKRYCCHLKQPKQEKVCSQLQQDQNNGKLTGGKYCISKDARFYYMNNKHPICLVCRKQHSSESSLKCHMDSIHTGGVNCKKCDLGFSAYNYSIHVVLGCGRSPFFNYTTDGECICPICNKVLNKFTNLLRHLLTHHSGEKLSCNVCNKIFDTFRLFAGHFTSSCAEHKRDSTVIKKEDGSKNLLRTRARTAVVQEAQKPNRVRRTRTQTPKKNDSTVFVEVVEECSNLRKISKQTSVKDPLATKLCQNEINTSDSATYNNEVDYSNTSATYNNEVDYSNTSATCNNEADYSNTSATCNNEADYSNTSGSSSTIIDTILDKSVKVEPTELLDQNLFMVSEESISNDQLAAAPGLDFLNNEEEIMDSPELIYIMPENKAID